MSEDPIEDRTLIQAEFPAAGDASPPRRDLSRSSRSASANHGSAPVRSPWSTMRTPFSTFIRTSRQRISRALGLGNKTRFVLAGGCRFFARGSRPRRLGQSMLAERVERRDARGCHEQSRHARRRGRRPHDCAGTIARRAATGRSDAPTTGSPESRAPGRPPRPSADAITPARVFFQALQTDGLEVTIDARAHASREVPAPVPEPAQCLIDRWAVKRRPAREELVEDRTEPVNVDRGGDLAALTRHLLGRHVRGRPEDEAGVRQAAVGLDALGQPEIGDVGLVVLIEQDV